MFHFCKEHVHIFHRGFKHFLVFTFPCEKTKKQKHDHVITCPWDFAHGKVNILYKSETWIWNTFMV